MANSRSSADGNLIWGNLVHLSYNMWEDRFVKNTSENDYTEMRCYRPELRFDDGLWNDILKRMSDGGMNMLVLDIGDGIRYKSHPEISVVDAWSLERLGEELDKMRSLGLEPIPKLNFAATHDAWLGEYSRRVSTPEYYEVCSDLIAEVVELFDTPRFFHLGMDEETAQHQRNFAYVVIRQFELFWHDLKFLCDKVSAANVRPWVWSDYIWAHEEEFLNEMPATVLQSNWYYGEDFSRDNTHADAYRVLEAAGYDQVPTGSNHSSARNFGMTADHCRKVVDPSRLFGFLQTPWRPTTEAYRKRHEEAVDQVAESIRAWAAR